ncbi:MAG: adenine deaminase [Acidobacteria bacterium]|nr:adenine deaminase [Acidobacteriota bacterium]
MKKKNLTTDLKEIILASKGEMPLDLKITGGKVVSVFDSQFYESQIGIKNGFIVTLEAEGLNAVEEINVDGAYISPSYIDAHIHIESSMLTPERFAEVVVPKGTGAVVSDPHEIANVLGVDGVKYMYKASKNLPLDFYFTIPSCVPATNLETSGGEIKSSDLGKVKKILKNSPALSEMMNFPGVIFCDEEVLSKIELSKRLGLKIDGHSPFLSGKSLDAYLSAGIQSDHECTTKEEVGEKLRKGCFIFAREGSASKNLTECLKVINSKNVSRFAIVSDDRHPETLFREGHIDDSLRKAVFLGLDPIDAIKLVTINPATFFNLHRKGAVAPSYYADLVILKDLKNFEAEMVIHRGKICARNGNLVKKIKPKMDSSVLSTIRVSENLEEKIRFPKHDKVRVIKVFGDQILTKEEILDFELSKTGEINFAAVIERHGKNGNVGLGFVKGFNLEKGALASTVSHDSHNIVAVGKTPTEIIKAVRMLQEIGGGIVALDEKSCIKLRLEVAGLMTSNKVENVLNELKALHNKAKEMGCRLPSPFMTLSFIALPVIPELRLTDKGLVDVNKFCFVPLKA